MKQIFWGFGIAELAIAFLPSRLTARWLGISHDTGLLVDTITLLTAIVCIGIGCIIHEMQKHKAKE